MSRPVDFDMGEFQVSGSTGLDALFKNEPDLITPHKKGRRRVASVQDIASFVRISQDTLVHKSTQDLWSLSRTTDGKYFVERLFDDSGEPLKG